MDISLYPPLICLSPSSSNQNLAGTDIAFASVYKINMYSISIVQVGDNVSFPFTEARLVTEGTAQFYLIDESKLLFKENNSET